MVRTYYIFDVSCYVDDLKNKNKRKTMKVTENFQISEKGIDLASLHEYTLVATELGFKLYKKKHKYKNERRGTTLRD